jgi:hypothetical protein
MKHFAFLEPNDVILRGDLFRHLYTFGNWDTDNCIKWQRVEKGMPYWIGKTFKEFVKFDTDEETYEVEIIREIV